MNWILIAVLAIIFFNAMIGLRVGFIKTVFSLVSMIAALLISVWLSPNVSSMLKSNEKFHSMVKEQVVKMLDLEEKEKDISDEEEFMKGLPLPVSIKESLIEQRDKGVKNLKEYITSYVTGLIINAVAFILTFILAMIALWALCFALNIVSKLPILNSINKLAGFAAGLVHGLVIVWVVFILITMFGGAKFGQDAFAMIERSKILSIIYDNNLLLKFITNAVKLF
jgi:uncharacterized membrane protein required for colicin V production